MDTRVDAREIIKRFIREYAAIKPSYGEVEVETVFDDASGHYQLLHNGWDQQRRIHGCLLHVDVRGDKVIVQHDGTEEGIANELVAAGILPENIVLAFHHPAARKHTEFAVA